jgi:hypothetical protein
MVGISVIFIFQVRYLRFWENEQHVYESMDTGRNWAQICLMTRVITNHCVYCHVSLTPALIKNTEQTMITETCIHMQVHQLPLLSDDGFSSGLWSPDLRLSLTDPFREYISKKLHLQYLLLWGRRNNSTNISKTILKCSVFHSDIP